MFDLNVTIWKISNCACYACIVFSMVLLNGTKLCPLLLLFFSKHNSPPHTSFYGKDERNLSTISITFIHYLCSLALRFPVLLVKILERKESRMTCFMKIDFFFFSCHMLLYFLSLFKCFALHSKSIILWSSFNEMLLKAHSMAHEIYSLVSSQEF